MGTVYSSILLRHEEFIRKQRIFFVGSAPLSADGHVNISAKGHDVLRIYSPTEVAYLDLTGSGNETSAHLKDNGRITFMFIAFEGPPMILRHYGRGKVVLLDTPEWDDIANHFDILPGARQIKPGDLVFFSTYKPGPSHVGMYVGDGKFINSNDNGLEYSSVEEWKKQYPFLGFRRIQ